MACGSPGLTLKNEQHPDDSDRRGNRKRQQIWLPEMVISTHSTSIPLWNICSKHCRKFHGRIILGLSGERKYRKTRLDLIPYNWLLRRVHHFFSIQPRGLIAFTEWRCVFCPAVYYCECCYRINCCLGWLFPHQNLIVFWCVRSVIMETDVKQMIVEEHFVN